MEPACEFEYFVGAVRSISEALSQASVKGIKRLLVDSTGLTGFPPPDLPERFFMAEHWARNSSGLIFSMVALPEMIDPFRFGVLVARGRGLFADIFRSDAEAVEWLLQPKFALGAGWISDEN